MMGTSSKKILRRNEFYWIVWNLFSVCLFCGYASSLVVVDNEMIFDMGYLRYKPENGGQVWEATVLLFTADQ